MNIRLEHIIIILLLVYIFFKETKNEERIQWTDYAGRSWDIRVDRRVH